MNSRDVGSWKEHYKNKIRAVADSGGRGGGIPHGKKCETIEFFHEII